MIVISAADSVLTARYKDLRFQVLDGDTGRPIGGVTLRAENQKPTQKFVTAATTDASGIATISVESATAEIRFTASDYLPMSWHRYSHTKDPPRTIVMYRPPVAVAGLEIPRDFRGMFRVRHPARPFPPPFAGWARGQREFYTPVNIHRTTTLIAPPVTRGGIIQTMLMRVSVARFDDGAPLRYDNPPAIAGLGQGLRSPARLGATSLNAPSGDDVALFNLGMRVDLENGSSLNSGHKLFWIGTRDQAITAQRRLVENAAVTKLSSAKGLAEGYYFKPARLP